jgi:uncharacterized membrane protein YqjE
VTLGDLGPVLAQHPPRNGAPDRDLGALLKATAQDATHLVEQEAKLLKREIELKVARAQRTLSIGAVGALGAMLTLATGTATVVLGLAALIPAWAAALIATAAWALIALLGLGWAKRRSSLQSSTPDHTRKSIEPNANPLEEAIR